MPAEPAHPDLTDDAILGGRLKLLQPRRGHRFGHDAVLLAAAVQAQDGEHAVDLGAGVGAAGLALATRVPGLRVTLLEVDPALAGLAGANAQRNGMAHRADVRILDVCAPPSAFLEAGLSPASADLVLMNPPFNDPARHRASPDPTRRAAHELPHAALDRWVEAAHWLLRPDGIVTLIFRPEGVADLLGTSAAGFGGVRLLPIYGKPGATAIRVLACARKNGRAPLAILPGLWLTQEGGVPSPQAEAVLRHAHALRLDLP